MCLNLQSYKYNMHSNLHASSFSNALSSGLVQWLHVRVCSNIYRYTFTTYLKERYILNTNLP